LQASPSSASCSALSAPHDRRLPCRLRNPRLRRGFTRRAGRFQLAARYFRFPRGLRLAPFCTPFGFGRRGINAAASSCREQLLRNRPEGGDPPGCLASDRRFAAYPQCWDPFGPPTLPAPQGGHALAHLPQLRRTPGPLGPELSLDHVQGSACIGHRHAGIGATGNPQKRQNQNSAQHRGLRSTTRARSLRQCWSAGLVPYAALWRHPCAILAADGVYCRLPTVILTGA
jgi:hypothetical protein